MLQEIAEEESRQRLRRAYQNYAKQAPDEIVRRLVGAEEIPAAPADDFIFRLAHRQRREALTSVARKKSSQNRKD